MFKPRTSQAAINYAVSNFNSLEIVLILIIRQGDEQREMIKQNAYTLEKNDPHNSGALYHLVAT